MKNKRTGFTLIELVVVVLIIGILTSISMPYYYKTIETSKATDSLALGHMLGNAYRMYLLDNPGDTLSGSLSNDCNGKKCADASGACKLVACSYVAQQDWDSSSYIYSVGGSCGGAACTKRDGGSGNYSGWGYNFGMDGSCTPQGGAPDCPRF